jgi:hypothetical protein
MSVSRVRRVLNTISAFNLGVVFFVYGGPMIINCFTGINTLCVLIGSCINSFNQIIWLENLAVLVATVITLQCSYVIIVAAFEVHTRRLKKTE